jgi:transcriptional antiterminator
MGAILRVTITDGEISYMALWIGTRTFWLYRNNPRKARGYRLKHLVTDALRGRIALLSILKPEDKEQQIEGVGTHITVNKSVIVLNVFVSDEETEWMKAEMRAIDDKMI